MKDINLVTTLDELFSLWETKTDCFVRDGIFDENKFENPKVLFVLRDAHIVLEKSNPPYDLRDIVDKPEGEGRTWNNIARWTRVILDGAAFEEVEAISPSMLSAQLRRIAAMNLKKEAGGARAERIEEFASQHREFINRQLEIINPDIIIACGTYTNIKRNVYMDTSRNKDFATGTKYRKFILELNHKFVPVIDFYHPQYNKKNKELAEDMLKIRKELFPQQK